MKYRLEAVGVKMRKLFIGIEGPIGAGKSYLTRRLAEHFGYHAMFEPVETNPYLGRFYLDMRRWAFPMQIHLLHARYILHQRAKYSSHGVVQDRTALGDVVFLRMLVKAGLITEIEADTYYLAWEAMRQTIVYPDMMLFVDAPTPVLQTRIKEWRGRPEEQNITDDYLDSLRSQYEELYTELSPYTICKRYNWTDPDKYFNQVVMDIEIVARTTGSSWQRARPTMLEEDKK